MDESSLIERVALWDNLKFLLVTCVVIGHFADQFTDVSLIYDSIFLFIYSFHIPLFIFISGIFYKKIILQKRLSSLSAWDSHIKLFQQY